MESGNALVPAGHFRTVAAEFLTSEDQLYYRSLGDDELLHVLKVALGNVNSTSVRMSEEIRQHLLPALAVLRERYMHPGRRKSVPDSPTYYEVLESLNLKPDTVRKWFKRTAGADVVLGLLGVRKEPIQPPRLSVTDPIELLLHAADQMAGQLVRGKIAEATKLAQEYLEARNS